MGGVWFQLAAELRDVDAEVVRLGLVGGPPDLLEQLLLGDELAFVPDQHLQEMPLGGRETDGLPVGSRLLGGQVDREARGSTTGASGSRPLLRSAARSRASSSFMPNGLVM